MGIITDIQHYRTQEMRMSCQCEIYEICAQCAPSQEAFLKAVHDHDEVVSRQPSSSSSPSYTLADLKTLIAQWINEQEGDTEMLKWTMSILIEWLAKKEREANER